MIINFKFNENMLAERNQEFLGAGREYGFSKNRLKRGDLIKKSLNDSIKDKKLKQLNIKNKVVEIINILNNWDNLRYSHLVYKAISGKDLSSFLKDDHAKRLRGLSFVFRLKDENNIWFSKNSIIIETTLVKDKDRGIAYFDIENIFNMTLPQNPHMIMSGMIEINQIGKLILNPESPRDFESIWIKDLKKPIDIWEDDSKMNISLWRLLMTRLNQYNEERKKTNSFLFAYSETCYEIKILLQPLWWL